MAIILRRIRLFAVASVLLLTVWLGIKGGTDAFANAVSTLQRLAAVLELCYGIAAVACLGALSTRSAWLQVALAVWGVTLTITALLAPVVWGGQGWVPAAVGGGATAIVAAVVAWGALAHAKAVAPTLPSQPRPTPPQSLV